MSALLRCVAASRAAAARAASSASMRSVATASLHTSRPAFAESTTPASTSAAAGQEAPSKDPQLGDYPDMPFQSRQLRKWSPRWWDSQEKVNYGETLHEQDDVLSVWAPDMHPNTRPTSALFQLLVVAGVIGVFSTLVYASHPELPAVARSYPRAGLADELGGAQVAAKSSEAAEEEEESEE